MNSARHKVISIGILTIWPHEAQEAAKAMEAEKKPASLGALLESRFVYRTFNWYVGWDVHSNNEKNILDDGNPGDTPQQTISYNLELHVNCIPSWNTPLSLWETWLHILQVTMRVSALCHNKLHYFFKVSKQHVLLNLTNENHGI